MNLKKKIYTEIIKNLKNDPGINGNGTDEYGFSALPGGSGSSNVGNTGYWWSASEKYSITAYNRYMYCSSDDAHKLNANKSGLFSVRCLQDFN